MDLTDPTAAALRIAEAFDAAQTPYALYGGLLLAAYGEPRETRDVDLAVLSTPQGQFVGLDQINIGPLPRSLAGRGEVNVVLTADAKQANPVTVNIQ